LDIEENKQNSDHEGSMSDVFWTHKT
jgi:hypothetical protein